MATSGAAFPLLVHDVPALPNVGSTVLGGLLRAFTRLNARGRTDYQSECFATENSLNAVLTAPVKQYLRFRPIHGREIQVAHLATTTPALIRNRAEAPGRTRSQTQGLQR